MVNLNVKVPSVPVTCIHTYAEKLLSLLLSVRLIATLSPLMTLLLLTAINCHCMWCMRSYTKKVQQTGSSLVLRKINTDCIIIQNIFCVCYA